MAWWSKCSHLRIENLCWDRVISEKSTWLKPQSPCGMEIKIFPHKLHCWLTLRPQTNSLLWELKGHCCLLQRLIVQALVWGEGVLQWWLEEGGESPVCPSRNYPISLSLSLDTARQYRQYMVTYKSVLNCMVISWTARKPTLYLLHGLVLSWTHCKPTRRTAPAISRAPILRAFPRYSRGQEIPTDHHQPSPMAILHIATIILHSSIIASVWILLVGVHVYPF